MTMYYVIHRDDVGKHPAELRPCATWETTGPDQVAPTIDDLRQWIREYGATFPCAVVVESTKAIVLDDRF